jgi:hypothetical protein
VSTFQVKPTSIFAAQFNSTLLKDNININITLSEDCREGVVLAFDGTCLTKGVDGLKGIATCLELALSYDEVHLCETEHDTVAVREVKAEIGGIVRRVEELLDTWIGVLTTDLLVVIAIITIDIRNGFRR